MFFFPSFTESPSDADLHADVEEVRHGDEPHLDLVDSQNQHSCCVVPQNDNVVEHVDTTETTAKIEREPERENL